MGPIIGPICCGFITEQVGVKYVFIFIACLNGSTLVLGVPFLRETFAPVVRVRRAKVRCFPVLRGEERGLGLALLVPQLLDHIVSSLKRIQVLIYPIIFGILFFLL